MILEVNGAGFSNLMRGGGANSLQELLRREETMVSVIEVSPQTIGIFVCLCTSGCFPGGCSDWSNATRGAWLGRCFGVLYTVSP